MRKTILMAGILFTLTMTAGCGNQDQGNAASETQTQDTAGEESTAVQSENTDADSKILVAYYSATGNTKAAAEKIAEATNGELFELQPAEAYTTEDLDYNDPESRVCKEHDDPDLQDVKLAEAAPEDFSDVDVVFLGYPIWWGEAAWPVNEFVKENDFTGKTVIPFCTSASSGLGDSGENLAEMAGTGEWQEGMRFSSNVSMEDVDSWVESLDLTR